MEYRLRGPEWKWARPDEKAVEQSTGKMTGLGLGGNCVALVGWGGQGPGCILSAELSGGRSKGLKGQG